MSVGALQTEADLQRWLQQELAVPATFTPRIMPGVVLTEEAITKVEIQTEAIEAGHIKAGAITAGQIAAGTILGDRIAAGTITAENIAAHTITAGEIAAGTITAELIEAGSITTELLAAGAVVASKIAAGTIEGANIKAGTITGSLVAGETLEGKHIKAGTVEAKQLSVSELSAITANMGKLTSGSIVGAEIKTASANPKVLIDSAGITGFNVAGEAKFHFDTATGILYAEGVIGAEEGSAIPTKYLAGQITETQIENEAITTPLLAANSVTAVKIVASTITGSKIAAGTITAEKLSVTKLSAITADLGTVTAGTLKAVTVEGATIKGTTVEGSTFKTPENAILIDSTGLRLRESTSLEAPETSRSVLWVNSENKPRAEIVGAAGAIGVFANRLNPLKEGSLELKVFDKAGHQSGLVFTRTEATGVIKVTMSELAEPLTLLDAGGASSFLQLPTSAKRKINTGQVEVEMLAANTTTAYVKVTHGIGATPKVNATVTSEGTGAVGGMFAEVKAVGGTTFEVRGARPFGAPGKIIKFTIDWIAVG